MPYLQKHISSVEASRVALDVLLEGRIQASINMGPGMPPFPFGS
jgi:hypothetical protein